MSDPYRTMSESFRQGAERLLADARAALSRGEVDRARECLEPVAETAMVPDHLRRDAATLLAEIAGEEHTLSRTGDAPLRFRGVVLANGSSERHEGPGQNRYHLLTVYRTASGSHVVRAQYCSRWRDDPERDDAWVCDSPEEVIRTVREYDPIPPGVGFPLGEYYEAKQQRLLADLRGRWVSLVAKVLGECRFSERVP